MEWSSHSQYFFQLLKEQISHLTHTQDISLGLLDLPPESGYLRHRSRGINSGTSIPKAQNFFIKRTHWDWKKWEKKFLSLSLSGKGPGYSLFSGACPMAILTHPWEKNIGQAVALPGMKYIGQCFLILGKNGVISSVVAPSLGMKPQLNEQKLFKIFLTNSMQTTLNRHTIFRWR